MKSTILFLATFLFVLSSCQENDINPFKDGKWIDLSHSYDTKTPYWPTAEGFQLDTVFAGMTELGYYYSAFQFTSAEHGGTHIDAPIHFAEGRKSVDEITLDQLTGMAIVINVKDSVSDYIDYQVSVDDFKNWESAHGPIPDGAIILLNTGFSNFWPDRMK